MEIRIYTNRDKYLEAIKECMTNIGNAKKVIETICYEKPKGMLEDGFEDLSNDILDECNDDLCDVIVKLSNIVGEYHKIEVQNEVM